MHVILNDIPPPYSQHPCNNSYFLGGSVVKNLPANAGDMSSVPESGRSPGEDDGNSLQYSCLENPVDREAWKATIHGVAKSRTWLNVHACIITGTWPCVCGKIISPCRRCGLKLTEEYERKVRPFSLTRCMIYMAAYSTGQKAEVQTLSALLWYNRKISLLFPKRHEGPGRD